MRSTMVVACLVLAVAACGSDSVEPLILTDSDMGSEILLDSGDRFEVRLKSNATTGYKWVIDEFIPNIVELRGEGYEEPETDLVGTPGTQVFVFEALREGAGILRMEYSRGIILERVAEFIVRVDGAPWPPEDPGTPSGTSTASVP